MKLDKMDEKILGLLREDSRMTYKEIAKKVGSNINTVASRIKRLERNKLILGYNALIDYGKIGFSANGIARLKLDSAESLTNEALSDIIRMPQTSVVVGSTGCDDVSVVIRAKDFDSLLGCIDKIGKNKHVQKLCSEYVIKNYMEYEEFNPFMNGSAPQQRKLKKRKKRYDDLDFAILRELKGNANAPLRVLSDKLKTPISTIKERTDRMYEDGTIKRFVANVNFPALGYWSFAAIRIKLKADHVNDPAVVERIMGLPVIVQLIRIMGEYDLVAGVILKSQEHLTEMIKRISSIEGVKDVQTNVAIAVLKTTIDHNPLSSYRMVKEKA